MWRNAPPCFMKSAVIYYETPPSAFEISVVKVLTITQYPTRYSPPAYSAFLTKLLNSSSFRRLKDATMTCLNIRPLTSLKREVKTRIDTLRLTVSENRSSSRVLCCVPALPLDQLLSLLHA